VDVGEDGEDAGDDRERCQQTTEVGAKGAGDGGQREHEPKRREAPGGEVPPGRCRGDRGRRGCRWQQPQAEREAGRDEDQRQRRRWLDRAQNGDAQKEGRPAAEHGRERPGLRRDPPVDDHEGGQGGQPEQGASGGVGTEGTAVDEGLDQQDRSGDDG
jgi:hypothetical protein